MADDRGAGRDSAPPLGASSAGPLVVMEHITKRFPGVVANDDVSLELRAGEVLIKALEPYLPMFVEEPVNCQDHNQMAEIARGTHLPIATGERVYTKWGFREVLEKKAAIILQPDLCHAGASRKSA